MLTLLATTQIDTPEYVEQDGLFLYLFLFVLLAIVAGFLLLVLPFVSKVLNRRRDRRRQ